MMMSDKELHLKMKELQEYKLKFKTSTMLLESFINDRKELTKTPKGDFNLWVDVTIPGEIRSIYYLPSKYNHLAKAYIFDFIDLQKNIIFLTRLGFNLPMNVERFSNNKNITSYIHTYFIKNTKAHKHYTALVTFLNDNQKRLDVALESNCGFDINEDLKFDLEVESLCRYWDADNNKFTPNLIKQFMLQVINYKFVTYEIIDKWCKILNYFK